MAVDKLPHFCKSIFSFLSSEDNTDLIELSWSLYTLRTKWIYCVRRMETPLVEHGRWVAKVKFEILAGTRSYRTPMAFVKSLGILGGNQTRVSLTLQWAVFCMSALTCPYPSKQLPANQLWATVCQQMLLVPQWAASCGLFQLWLVASQETLPPSRWYSHCLQGWGLNLSLSGGSDGDPFPNLFLS